MTVKEDVESAIKEALLPELSALRKVFSETKTILGTDDRCPGGGNKRLDDLVAI
jgi:hypothetical protein